MALFLIQIMIQNASAANCTASVGDGGATGGAGGAGGGGGGDGDKPIPVKGGLDSGGGGGDEDDDEWGDNWTGEELQEEGKPPLPHRWGAQRQWYNTRWCLACGTKAYAGNGFCYNPYCVGTSV